MPPTSVPGADRSREVNRLGSSLAPAGGTYVPLATSAAQVSLSGPPGSAGHHSLYAAPDAIRGFAVTEEPVRTRPFRVPGDEVNPSGAQAGPARLPANPQPSGFGRRVRRATPRVGPQDFQGVWRLSRLDSDPDPAPRRVVRVRPCQGCCWRFDRPPVRVAPPPAPGLKTACRLFPPSLPVPSSARCRYGALASPFP